MDGCAGASRAGAAFVERTLAMVKPDAVAAGAADEILHLAELAGFTVIQKRQMQVRCAAEGACSKGARSRNAQPAASPKNSQCDCTPPLPRPQPLAHLPTPQLTAAQAEDFYAEHRGRPFFPGLVEFMTSGPLVAAALAAPDAVAGWRRLIGPTNADEARAKAPKRWGRWHGARHAGRRRAVGPRMQRKQEVRHARCQDGRRRPYLPLAPQPGSRLHP